MHCDSQFVSRYVLGCQASAIPHAASVTSRGQTWVCQSNSNENSGRSKNFIKLKTDQTSTIYTNLLCNFVAPCSQTHVMESFIKIRLNLTDKKQFKQKQTYNNGSPSQLINSTDPMKRNWPKINFAYSTCIRCLHMG